MIIELQRIYESAGEADNYRVLVDRLWPRGIFKDKAKLDAWEKDWAPSNELRKRFHSSEIDWGNFKKSYQKELEANRNNIKEKLESYDLRKKIILLYASKDPEQNHARLLKEFLQEL